MIVCSRFSAWSNTMLAGDSKTSPVTSRPLLMPVCSIISRPTTVFGSWNAGRQCMNFTRGLPDFCNKAELTWYGVSSPTRSVHTSLDSPIDTQTSVCTKSAPETASPASSVIVICAPVRVAMSRAILTTSSGGASDVGPARRTSAPRSAPVTSSDRPMLNRQSPTNA